MPATQLTNFAVLNLTAYSDGVVFTPSSAGQTNQLWRSDGSQAGTTLVKDLGANGSKPSYLTVAGGRLFFAADSGSSGRELWASDGSNGGTVLLKDVNPGSASGLPAAFPQKYRYVTAVNGTLFFAGTTATGGTELWKSDGTSAGTVLVKDIATGTYNGLPDSSYPYEMTAFGRNLLFVAYDANGAELWKSDGTSAGTVQLKDITVGAYGGYPAELTVAGSTLFFSAEDPRNGRELWKSDGTSRGTVLVSNLITTSTAGYADGSYPTALTAVGSSLFFLADSGSGDDLWISDGTATGTRSLSAGRFSAVDGLTAVGTTLFFTALSGNDRELWKSDGTVAGTQRVADINSSGSSNPDQLTAVGERLYFSANDGKAGRELWSWRWDGSKDVTELVEDLNPGLASSNPNALTPSGQRLFFNATGSGGAGLWQVAVPAYAPPGIAKVAISGSTAILTFSRPVAAVGGSANPAFFLVSVDGTLIRGTAATLNPAGTELNLTLASAPAATAIADIVYCPPAGASTGSLRGLDGTAMPPLTINGATTADTYRSSTSVSGLALTYTSLELLGTAAINATANQAANRIRGNSATNVLNGLAGLDDLDGREGGDIYLVSSASDHGNGLTQAAEFRDSGSSGVDQVRFAATSTAGGARLTLAAAETGLEQVAIGTGSSAAATTTGTTALEVDASAAPNALTLVGNDGANRLIGTAFADTLIGNKGNDSLSGGAGSDSFVFNQTPGSGNRDTLTDFRSGTDKLTFSKGVYRALGSGSGITSSQLCLIGSSAATTTTRFLFDGKTGLLAYDADGSGSKSAAQEVALLQGVTTLATTDFTLIA